MKKLLSLILVCALLFACALGEGGSARDELVSAISNEVEKNMSTPYADLFIYRNMDWDSIADTLPSSFDLRDRGVVPPVRSQGNWGTCWGFASIAAAEISMLSSIGMTYDEFREANGYDMDLSERHLAWFGTNHLPSVAEGDTSFIASQVGEGTWHSNDDTEPDMAHYMSGGYMGYASSVFANGMGPQWESEYPYTANDGSASTSADWSLKEEDRYGMAAQLKNSSILPNPSLRDENDNYVYNAAGTEAIKQELLAGRAVSIVYHGDQAMTPEARCNEIITELKGFGIPEDGAQVYASVGMGLLDPQDMTEEQVRLFVTTSMQMDGVSAADITDEDVDRIISESFDELAQDVFGSYVNTGEEVYMCTDTYAQYTYTTGAAVDHAVTIIGWDDDYAVTNFLPEHQPPAPGAWIVRNSWGAGYGNDGYFYLSYYDQTITFAETFEFAFDEDANNGVSIYSYDNMEAVSISSVQLTDAVDMANVFCVGTDNVLSYVSVMTADLNSKVTVSVYLLNEDYTSPTDGTLLDTVTESFEFGGYHRIGLSRSYQLPEGCTISVVERQSTRTTDGTRYTLPYTGGTSRDAAEESAPEGTAYIWSVGVINEGESFVGLDGEWYDWKDITDAAKETDTMAAFAEFDNLNIKAYLYTTDGVYAAHDFTAVESVSGGDTYVCDDCGNMLVVVG